MDDLKELDKFKEYYKTIPTETRQSFGSTFKTAKHVYDELKVEEGHLIDIIETMIPLTKEYAHASIDLQNAWRKVIKDHRDKK